MKSKTILITGANGFVGSNLYDSLVGEYRLIGIDIIKQGKFPPEDIFTWDDLERLPPVDTIIHLAGKAHDTSGNASEKEYFEINVGLTQRIFDYFLQSSAEKFILFSSVKAVADIVITNELTEDAVPLPQTPYGRSKLAAENYIIGEMKKRLGEDWSIGSNSSATSLAPHSRYIYVLRPAMIHGPGNKGNLNLLYKIVKKGFPWPLGAFDNQRSFAYIGNVAYVVSQLIERPIVPNIYHVADDEPLSTNELIEVISSSLGRQPNILHLPVGIVSFLSRTGDILHLPLNSERLKKLTENYIVSNNLIKSALGIEKMPTPARLGLELTLRSFLKSF